MKRLAGYWNNQHIFYRILEHKLRRYKNIDLP